MAVERVEQYEDVLKVILKPTKKFPEGMNYFYTDVEAVDLVQSRCWYLGQSRYNAYVVSDTSCGIHYKFHRELANKYLGYLPDYIDHCDGVVIDNVDKNLNIVTNQQNSFNKPTKNYTFDVRRNTFQPRILYNRETIYPVGVVHSEVEACILQHELETTYLRELMKDDYYIYNFFIDRRNDLDILDLERTKQISPEEATYRHVVRNANAWHYFRYNLEQYFKDNHIPVPSYDLDEQGFMIDTTTGRKLCPF